MEWFRKNTLVFLLGSITLGLMPYGDPHILGKLKWLIGGGAINGEHPMALIDWFDLVMHGTPWLLLIIALVAQLKKLLTPSHSK
ncbi:hypothetical protein [Crocinitomix algicola]|uniref:hypothetical protein n=1 Tax=Crocinitomix algicola TaxID=1740263 RepID=UPI000831EB52|nr:hypothetical protein [Crocinitomix algicola]